MSLQISGTMLNEYQVRQIKRFISNDSGTYLMYSANLGWTNRPNTTYDIYSSDAFGIRTDNKERKYEKKLIAVFGDSFVHGTGVPYNKTFSHVLEQNLEGYSVMNFGVSGYGIDQAYLRYMENKDKHHFDILIIGFQAENINRNVNLFRGFYSNDSFIQLLKPRFIIEEGRLKIINFPVPLPNETIELIMKDEEFFSRYDYAFSGNARAANNPSIIGSIRSFTKQVFGPRKAKYYSSVTSVYALDEEPAQLTLRIIEEFAADPEGRVYLLHLPKHNDLMSLRDKGRLEYQEMLDYLKSKYDVIDPSEDMLRFDVDSLFNGHYSELGNLVVGKAIYKHIYNET